MSVSAALSRVPGPVASTAAGNFSEMQIRELQPVCGGKRKVCRGRCACLGLKLHRRSQGAQATHTGPMKAICIPVEAENGSTHLPPPPESPTQSPVLSCQAEEAWAVPWAYAHSVYEPRAMGQGGGMSPGGNLLPALGAAAPSVGLRPL